MEADLLLNDKARFRAFVYTPLAEAVAELNKRRTDSRLREATHRFISNDLPEPFRKQPRLTLLRYINTPNYEVMRFLDIAKNYSNIPPLLCEYPQDKFVPSNTPKRLLGKLATSPERGSSGTPPIDRVSIIDFEKSQNAAFADITTLWGQALVSFHHDLFPLVLPDETRDYWYDISPWYRRHGPTAKQYYAKVLALFVRDGILFENFIIQQKDEASFFRHTVLPAFLEVWRTTGKKPLIVALEPPETEGDRFWLCYPTRIGTFAEEKLGSLTRES